MDEVEGEDTRLLVKWLGAPYSACTYELCKDLDDAGQVRDRVRCNFVCLFLCVVFFLCVLTGTTRFYLSLGGALVVTVVKPLEAFFFHPCGVMYLSYASAGTEQFEPQTLPAMFVTCNNSSSSAAVYCWLVCALRWLTA